MTSEDKDNAILDRIDKILQKGYSGPVETFFAVGTAIIDLLASGLYKETTKASQHISWAMQKRGHDIQFNHGYFYDAAAGAKALTKAQQGILVKSGMCLTKVRYLVTRSDKEYIVSMVRDIRDGHVKFPFPELKRKQIRVARIHAEGGIPGGGTPLSMVNQITIDLTPPIDVERVTDSLTAVLCRLPASAIDEAVFRAKKVAAAR